MVAHVLEHGRPRTVRGLATRDAGFLTLLLDSPYDALPLRTGRLLNRGLAAAEALQLIGGISTPQLLVRIAPQMAQYLDDGRFHGAYGERVKHQVAAACTRLQHDPGTRQAVVVLWDAWLDNLPAKRDYPCTVALQFEVDDRTRLCLNVFMRSNDAWLGLPYDLFQFAQLQLSVARALSRPLGWYRHTVLSMHLYERDLEGAGFVHAATEVPFQPTGIGREGWPFPRVMRLAQDLLGGVEVIDETPSLDWYRKALRSYLGPRSE